MLFEFATAGRILFGPGVLRQVGVIAAEHGRRALFVTGGSSARLAPLLEVLAQQGLEHQVASIPGEPTIAMVAEGAELARQSAAELVIGYGGGSALDAGKAIAALAANGGDPFDYLEVIGRGQPLARPSLPFIAIPTTAGTGSEVTRNAVLCSPEHRVKVSLRSPSMLPRAAIVDPELTHSMPPEVTAASGLDALTQLIEPYVCNRANPLSDALCQEGMSRAARSLRRAYEQGQDAAAREDMALASLCGGLALANARLGAVHGFANPIGGMSPAPHGAICARLLPIVMEANIRALREVDPQAEALQRYAEIAQILSGDNRAEPLDGVAWVVELCRALQIRPLSSYGLSAQDLPAVVEKAAAANSMQGNPVKLTEEELSDIVLRAL